MNQGPGSEASLPDFGGPIALDGLVYGIDLLDALLVFQISDASLHALWVRPESGLAAEELAPGLRDAFRAAHFVARRLDPRRTDLTPPTLSIELPGRVALLRRIRGHVVATLFESAMPLGMARLVASRLAAALEPELPLSGAEPSIAPPPPAIPKVRLPIPPAPAAPTFPRSRWSEPAPNTLEFGPSLPQPIAIPAPKPVQARTSKLLAYLEEHAPEPHVVKHRLALRAGLTLAALDKPDALGPEAIVLIETAVQDILGIDRAELKRIA